MLFLLFIYGAVMGSFINSLLCRLEHEQPIITKHSFCPSCKKNLSWYELFPLVSFLFLRGRCRSCRQAIPRRYVFVELACGLGCLTAGFLFDFPWTFDPLVLHSPAVIGELKFAATIPFLFFFFLFDVRTGLVPDSIILPLSGLLLIVNLWTGSWISFLFAGILAGGFFAVQFFISRGRWVGAGDIRLGFFMGLLLGWPWVIIALFIAYGGGAVISLLLILFRKARWKTEIPFALFLMPATLVTGWWGHALLAWYTEALPLFLEKMIVRFL